MPLAELLHRAVLHGPPSARPRGRERGGELEQSKVPGDAEGVLGGGRGVHGDGSRGGGGFTNLLYLFLGRLRYDCIHHVFERGLPGRGGGCLALAVLVILFVLLGRVVVRWVHGALRGDQRGGEVERGGPRGGPTRPAVVGERLLDRVGRRRVTHRVQPGVLLGILHQALLVPIRQRSVGHDARHNHTPERSAPRFVRRGIAGEREPRGCPCGLVTRRGEHRLEAGEGLGDGRVTRRLRARHHHTGTHDTSQTLGASIEGGRVARDERLGQSERALGGDPFLLGRLEWIQGEASLFD